MKPLFGKDYHELFRIGILIKAADGLIETSAGIFLYFVNYSALSAVFFPIFHSEIVENPRDTIWEYLINEWHSLALSGHSFWGLLFIAHGITKLALSAALLKNYLWAYPTAAAVFMVFVIYELYSLMSRPSLLLWLIAIFDILVIGLIVNEYQHIKKNRTV